MTTDTRKETCKTCGADCTKHRLMCDEEPSVDAVYCPDCFEDTPCGQGEHDEGCMTRVLG